MNYKRLGQKIIFSFVEQFDHGIITSKLLPTINFLLHFKGHCLYERLKGTITNSLLRSSLHLEV